MTSVGPIADHEYPAAADLWTATHPHDPYSAGDLRRHDAQTRALGYHARRWVARRAGEVRGVAALYHSVGSSHPQRYVLEGAVWPADQGQGLGAALWQTVNAELQARQALSVRVLAREDHPRAPHFLTRRGFLPTTRTFTSTLTLSGFDWALYAAAEARFTAAGLRVTSLAALRSQQTPELPARLHALFSEVRQDVPRSEPATPLTLESFGQLVLDDPALLPQGYLLALAPDGDLVGQTTLFRSGSSPDLLTGLTGVRREWRGQGVALRLKLEAIRLGLGLGAPVIRTDNASSNRPMLHLNDRLGFVRDPVSVSYLRESGDWKENGPPR